MPSIAENRMRLTRMTGPRALEAVINPGGPLITADVGRQVVRFVAGGRKDDSALDLAGLEVEPALLSLVCRELNNHRRAQDLPQITSGLLAGSRERILQDFYERSVGDQPPAVRAFVEDELITDSGLRENIALERARRVLRQSGVSPSAIDLLVQRRLLRLEERLDIQRVELTHDVLAPVVMKSRAERHQQEAASRLEAQAEAAREKARLQRRRMLVIVGAMAAALVVVSAFGAFSFYELQETRRARDEARLQKVRAEASRKLAEQSFAEARGTVDEVLTAMSGEGLKDLPGLHDLRQRFARKAVDRYAVYVARRPDDPAVAVGQARALRALGNVLGDVATVEQAVVTMGKAVQSLEELARQRPDDGELRLQLATTRNDLGLLYEKAGQNQRARTHLEQVLHELEPLLSRGEPDPNVERCAADTYLTLGLVMRNEGKYLEARRHYERGLPLALKVHERYPEDLECLRLVSYLYGNLAILARLDGDHEKALELENKGLELNESARQRFPHSPNLLVNRGIAYEAKGYLLWKLGRKEEGLKCYEEALSCFRTVARENPLDGQYQSALAYHLISQAWNMSTDARYPEAEALYKESCDILQSLTQRVDDRPQYATALIDSRLSLAMFYQGTGGDAADQRAQQPERLRCLDQAVEDGRRLSRKFPDDPELGFKCAEALFRRADCDQGAERWQEAYPFFVECLEVFRTRVGSSGRKPTEPQLGAFLSWMEQAQQCARELKRDDEVVRLTGAGYEAGKDGTDREGRNALGGLLSATARLHREAGRYGDAVETYTRALKIRTPALEKDPWHWPLRRNVAADYLDLADCQEKLGDFGSEVVARRAYLTWWLGPMHGMKIDTFTDSTKPATEAEAVALRKFVKEAPEMKPFTIRCDYGGRKYPFTIFITNVPWPKDPLEDQARWLEEVRYWTILEQDREMFRRLQKIAHENNVSFVDLCGYAVGTEKTRQLADQAGEQHDRAAASLAQGRRDDYRKSLTEEFETRGKLVELEPGDVKAKRDQAAVAVELAASYHETGEAKAVVQWTARAADLGHAESLLQLAGWYAKGSLVEADPAKARHYEYLGLGTRGRSAFLEHHYEDALPDLKKVTESAEAEAKDFDTLGQCYGKLAHWDEAIAAYTASVERDLTGPRSTGHVLNCLEAFIAADRPGDLFAFLQTIENKGWKLPSEGLQAKRNTALYHGFRAIALRATGQEAADDERAMRQITGNGNLDAGGWSWDEIDRWFQTTKLAPDRKEAVAKILDELRGKPEM
jgi:tetratricopeptide (TPR) repeat protein